MRAILMIFTCFFVFTMFGQEVPVISMEVPESVVAGNSFQVKLTLNKGTLKDYSRFSQSLPAGFSAENINSANGNFSFSDKQVKIIWLSLPDDEQFTAVYSVKVNERLSGSLELGGTFAYVNNGERFSIELPYTRKVSVLPNPDIDRSLVVGINEFEKIFEQKKLKYPEEQYASVIRQNPVVEANGIVQINLLIKTPEGSGFLKLEETIPNGYAFEAVESNDAVVSQSATLARFIWMNRPKQDIFLIKYRLVPILESQQGELIIEGNLVYAKDGKTMVDKVKELDVNLLALNSDQQFNMLATGSVSGEEISDVQNLGDIEKETKVAEIKKPAEKIEPVTKTPRKTFSESSKEGYIAIESLEPENGIYFRVQVAAVRNGYYANILFAQYDLLRNVKLEQSEGWIKYTVGSEYSIGDARALKDRIINETPVKNAFIVAYKNGQRVPLNSVL